MNIKPLFNSILSLLFILFFIGGQTFASVLPLSYQKVFLYTTFTFFVLLFLYCVKFKQLFFVKKSMFLSISFIIFGFISIVVNNGNSLFVLVGPFAAFTGLHFLSHHKLDLYWFILFFIGLYFFFYIEYYSVIPDYFFRPFFDEDAVVFDMSSSNAIPISLNLTLFSYMVLSFFYEKDNQKVIFFFSIINFILIIIQQSRAGILISLLMFFLASYHYNKKRLIKFLLILSIITSFSVAYYYSNIIEYIEIVGNINGIEAIDEDIRGEAQKNFFKDMDTKSFLFGYPYRSFAGVGDTEVSYTYNVLLDIWNRYGFFQAQLLILLFVYRIASRKKFYFPLYYFTPFIVYSLVESLFFPNYWDVIIYLLLFAPQKKVIH